MSNKKRKTGDIQQAGEDDVVLNAVNLAPASKNMNTRSQEVLDLTRRRADGDHWDFALGAHRSDAIEEMRRLQPLLVIGTSRHGTKMAADEAYSFNAGDALKRRGVKEKLHMDFITAMYSDQDEKELYFVHEQMHSDRSEVKQGFRKIQDLNGITVTVEAKKYIDLKKKIVKIVTNSESISSRISGSRSRIKGCEQKRTGRAEMCKDVRTGLRRQIKIDDAMEVDACEDEEGEFYDAITMQKLDSNLVRIARAEEIEYFTKMRVYTKVSKKFAFEKTGKAPLKVRWVDHNKGTAEKPNIRSRLVAKEIKVSDKPELFAATPPLEALKLILSLAACASSGQRCVMHNDVSRAYFHAPAIRDVFVDIVAEDLEAGDEEKCGWLNVSMYGTRDAARNWEARYREVLITLGFQQGASNPCVFTHRQKDIHTVVHGDDFTSEGEHDQLRWMQKKLEEQFALKTKVMGAAPALHKELCVLNRRISWDEKGIKYEADTKHVMLLKKDMNMEHCKCASTPGVKDTDSFETMKPLSLGSSVLYRSVAARCNYLSADRADIQYATTEVARGMAAPTERDWEKSSTLRSTCQGRPDCSVVRVATPSRKDCLFH